MEYLPSVDIGPTSNATASVIWLHGLGADGHDFEPIARALNLPKSLAVRFIFPHSPSIPVTINGGMVMPAWYDILDMSIERKVDVQQLNESANAIQALIDREVERGIEPSRIILAGFSQGGAVAYQAALSYRQPLAGLLAMSTYFATKDSIQIHDSNKSMNIAIMHGSLDPVVVPQLGVQAVEALEKKGFTPSFQQYAMEHCVCEEQIADISAWIQERLIEL
ncbi:alpha/beta hydrolase fold domain-containing protein [Vibrio sp. ZSDE26]|uniref:Alpha/beta hydrolase fold domain-containing protein n=1 Tax=Vibrio amylolyticus TaxID=2847292 RepID=A0A9X2BKK2_9VIBR|nr:alpha/beta hydrolase fold domain-containing protein [Vibrio amylolyticus]MCK6264637.1 alpha/beta hydrolase fold domain-containing protein [Vibrio amylolyticus]